MTPLRRHSLVAVLLCALCAVAYFGSLHASFVWDDNYQILRNPFMRPDQPLTKVLFTDVWGYIRGGSVSMSNYYRPLQMLTYRATNATAGPNPSVFHAVCLLFNVLASFAAYLVFWQLTKRFAIALAASVLFAVHPIHSEAVIWISALTEIGCALFYFLAFWFYLLAREPAPAAPVKRKRGAREAGVRQRAWLIAASCASLFIALLWKEMALSFPLVVAAHAFFVSRREGWAARVRESLWQSAPAWAVVPVYAALRIAVLGYFSRTQHAWSLTPLQFVANVIQLVGAYCWKLVAPLHLTAFHVFHPALSLADPRVLSSVAFLMVAAALVWFGARRAPIPTFAAVWIFVTLIPVLNIQGVGENVLAERYLYIPSLGFSLLLAWAGATLLRRVPAPAARAIAIAAVAAVSVAAIAEVRARVPDWQNDLTLYASATRVQPDAALMHISLAQILLDQKNDVDAAEREYRTGMSFAESATPPNRTQVANAYLGLSNVAFRRGQFEQSLEMIHKGLEADHTVASLHTAEGVLLLQMGRVAEAEHVLEQANGYFPYDEVILNSLGIVALARHDYPRAIDYLQRAVKVNPNFADGLNNLARAQVEAGKLQDSLPNFQRAVELAPSNTMFLTNYGVALARASRYPEARTQLQRALQIDPQNRAALFNMDLLNKVVAQGH